MKIAIVNYRAGNVCSVINAVRRLGVEPVYTDRPDLLRNADRVIFPGQGEASTAMAYLRDHGLVDVIRSLQQPVLGICIGQQLLCTHSEEGDTECMGIFRTDVRRFRPERHEDKVPVMEHAPSAADPTLRGACRKVALRLFRPQLLLSALRGHDSRGSAHPSLQRSPPSRQLLCHPVPPREKW